MPDKNLSILEAFAPGLRHERWNATYQTHPTRHNTRQLAEKKRTFPLLPVAPSLGEAWFPSLHKDGVGILVRVSVRRSDAPLNPDQLSEIWDWLEQTSGVHLADRFPLYFHNLPDTWQITGRSYGLAAVIALVSALLNRRPDRPALVSAQLREPAKIGAVQGVSKKKAICVREASEVDTYLLDGAEGDREEVPLEQWFPPNWRSLLGHAMRTSHEALAREALSSMLSGSAARAASLAERALRGELTDDARGRALWVRGAAALHAGDAVTGDRDLTDALELLEGSDQSGPDEWYSLIAQLGVALVDQGRPEASAQLLRKQLTNPATRPLTMWERQSQVQLRGTLHRALLLSGNPEAAQAALLSSKALCPSSERARVLGDLAEVERRMGHFGRANDLLDEATASLPHALPAERPVTARFLELYRVRARATGKTSAYTASLDWSQPWPAPAEALETLLHDPPALDAIPLCPLDRGPHFGFLLLSVAARAKVRPRWLPDLVGQMLRGSGIEKPLRAAIAAAETPEGLKAWEQRSPY